MEVLMRKPLQGVTNIIRFNWHFYLLAFLLTAILFICRPIVPTPYQFIVIFSITLVLVTTCSSLLISFYIYDLSSLYRLDWLRLTLPTKPKLVNVNSGFDETSGLLARKYPHAEITVLDFYDPEKHTEISIKRARAAYGTYPNTKAVQTYALDLRPESIDAVLCIFSAHEIRDDEERLIFFQQISYSLKENGKLIIVEHLRDFPNFLAYNIGFFHFHSKGKWLKAFRTARLELSSRQKITPFITVFTLQKHGTPS